MSIATGHSTDETLVSSFLSCSRVSSVQTNKTTFKTVKNGHHKQTCIEYTAKVVLIFGNLLYKADEEYHPPPHHP